MTTKRFSGQQFTSHAAAVATLAFVAFIATVVSLAGSNFWVNGTITQTTTTPGNGVTTMSFLTTYIEGTLTMMDSKVCAVSTTNPPPNQRPATQCTTTGFAGSPQSIYISSGCNTQAGSAYKVCNALSAMVSSTGFTTFLLVMMILLSAFMTASAAGLAYRSSRSSESAAAAGVSKDPAAPGSWLRFDQYSLDQSTVLMGLTGASALVAVIFIITWPSAIRNVFSLIIADIESQTTVPNNSTIAWSQNPMPGAGFWVAFGGCLALLASSYLSFKLWKAAKDARDGVGASPLFNPLDGGSSGAGAAYLPPAAVASSSTTGGEYAPIPSKADGSS